MSYAGRNVPQEIAAPAEELARLINEEVGFEYGQIDFENVICNTQKYSNGERSATCSLKGNPTAEM